MHVEPLSPPPDPVDCCERLAGLPWRLFLDSAASGARLGRYSFVSADPIAVMRCKGASVETFDARSGARAPSPLDALDTVRSLLAPHRVEAAPDLPPFQGGAAGYIAYDWGRTLERLPAPRYDDLAMPDVAIGIYDWVLAWDHQTSRAWLISTGMPETTPDAGRDRAAARAREIRTALQSAGALPKAEARATRETGDRPPAHPIESAWWDPRLDIRSSFTKAGYLDAVQRVRDYIYAGDIFQANLSQRFEAPFRETPWTFYRRLRTRNAAPFAAFLDFPGAAVLSASPERFLRVDVDGRVETRPIKGTGPRGLGPEHDAALGRALAESGKDRAENLMIVDLMRNDLSRVCESGSVRASELFELERYATVHHLVSTVVGTLSAGRDGFDLLRAAFPGGSITGAPKLRAMEIIAELEPSARGVYCGAIGYWSVTGAVDTNIAIRTAAAIDGQLYFNAGGAIVSDSDPEREYRETLDKARGMIAALAPA